MSESPASPPPDELAALRRRRRERRLIAGGAPATTAALVNDQIARIAAVADRLAQQRQARSLQRDDGDRPQC